MPLDGVVARNIVYELNNKLIDGKIDKISQPEKDEIILTIRNNNQNYKLLISSSPSYPRVQLTEVNKQNPITAPLFCMVLRKHLSGGRIVKVEQQGLDRIIKIFIESYDELGSLSSKVIISEIMGRHSNTILINEANNTIIDSMKHLTAEMNSYRMVLPGVSYKCPPPQDKLEPLNFDLQKFIERLNCASPGQKLSKFISEAISGFSIVSSREICYNAGLDEDSSAFSIDESSKKKLILSLEAFIESIINNDFSPCIYYNQSNIYDFYSFRLNYLSSIVVQPVPEISQTIEQFYSSKDKAERVKQRSIDISKVVNTNISRCLKKLSMQEEKLLDCKHKDKWKLYGDLLMANLYNIKKGDRKADVLNFFEESLSPIEIPLDFSKTPVENAQSFYKKYNKDKTAEIFTKEQKEENLEELQYFESLLVSLENCTKDNEIEEIRDELISLGVIKKGKKTASKKKVQSEPMHYISTDGTHIYVGKNNIQNDYLTLKFADSMDIWLHTKTIPGSHVIIKTNGKAASDATIFEAANLAAYYSKARSSSNVAVDYTEKKNVKKPSGAKPGMVIYYTNRTAYITPDIELIEGLKANK